ncbi:MAG: diaminopimelate decarboxylase [Burkholderiales bacterium]
MAFAYRNGTLCAERLPLDELAGRFATPCYVYSRAAIELAYAEYSSALAGRDALICYSVKANPNLALLALMARLGAGFDIVSGGELARVMAAGGDPGKTLFSGVGKIEREIEQALLAGVRCINLESEAELERVNALAGRLGRCAPVAFRVNPDVGARTHPYISTGLRQSKFGIPHGDAERLYAKAARMPNIEIHGIGCHVGSQLTDPAPFVEAAARIVALATRLEAAGIPIAHIDLGGGIGICDQGETPRPVTEFIAGALAALGARRAKLILDPGRSIVGNAGLLLTRIEYVKPGAAKNFLVVDAAMNDLLRPALYGAWHEVRAVHEAPRDAKPMTYDVVGPVCESGDFLARERPLVAKAGDLLAVMSAGAYGMSMSSNYNSRPRAAEVLVDGTLAHLIRSRETVEDLFALERILP